MPLLRHRITAFALALLLAPAAEAQPETEEGRQPVWLAASRGKRTGGFNFGRKDNNFTRAKRLAAAYTANKPGLMRDLKEKFWKSSRDSQGDLRKLLKEMNPDAYAAYLKVKMPAAAKQHTGTTFNVTPAQGDTREIILEKITGPSGEVMINFDAEQPWQEAKKGMALGPGTKIITFGGGTARVRYGNGSWAQVDTTSSFYIESVEKTRITSYVGLGVVSFSAREWPGLTFQVRNPLGLAATRTGAAFHMIVESAFEAKVELKIGQLDYKNNRGRSVSLQEGMSQTFKTRRKGLDCIQSAMKANSSGKVEDVFITGTRYVVSLPKMFEPCVLATNPKQIVSWNWVHNADISIKASCRHPRLFERSGAECEKAADTGFFKGIHKKKRALLCSASTPVEGYNLIINDVGLCARTIGPGNVQVINIKLKPEPYPVYPQGIATRYLRILRSIRRGKNTGALRFTQGNQ